MDEIRSGSSEPHYDAHCESHTDRESRPVYSAELTGSAVQLVRELRPCQPPFAAPRIECLIELSKIPTKPLIGAGNRKRGSLRIDHRACHETLWRATQPAKHKECMLACGVLPFR